MTTFGFIQDEIGGSALMFSKGEYVFCSAFNFASVKRLHKDERKNNVIFFIETKK